MARRQKLVNATAAGGGGYPKPHRLMAELLNDLQNPALPLHFTDMRTLSRELTRMQDAAARILVERLHNYQLSMFDSQPMPPSESARETGTKGLDPEDESNAESPGVMGASTTSSSADLLAAAFRGEDSHKKSKLPDETGRSAFLMACEQTSKKMADSLKGRGGLKQRKQEDEGSKGDSASPPPPAGHYGSAYMANQNLVPRLLRACRNQQNRKLEAQNPRVPFHNGMLKAPFEPELSEEDPAKTAHRPKSVFRYPTWRHGIRTDLIPGVHSTVSLPSEPIPVTIGAFQMKDLNVYTHMDNNRMPSWQGFNCKPSQNPSLRASAKDKVVSHIQVSAEANVLAEAALATKAPTPTDIADLHRAIASIVEHAYVPTRTPTVPLMPMGTNAK